MIRHEQPSEYVPSAEKGLREEVGNSDGKEEQ